MSEEEINRLNELDKLYKDRDKAIQKELKKRENALKKYDEAIKKINEPFTSELYNEYRDLMVKYWIERGKEGKNKGLKRQDIPKEVWSEFHEIEQRITGGCMGDPNDGCRGCNNNCHSRANKEWKEMFGLE